MNGANILRSVATGLCVVLAVLEATAQHRDTSPPMSATSAQETASPSSIAQAAQRRKPSSQTGSVVEGTITYNRDRKRTWRYQRYYVKGRNRGPLAEAVVVLSAVGGIPIFQKHRVSNTGSRLHVIDQKDFRFTPETLAIRAGDRIKFTNSDAVLHNVFSPSQLHRFDVNLRKGNKNIQTFDRAGGTRQPVRLRCAFHSSMQAWIFVFDHPHFQVTATDGRFRFADVPPGRYKLVMVHPAGELKVVRQLNVAANKTVRLDVRVSPDNKLESKRK